MSGARQRQSGSEGADGFPPSLSRPRVVIFEGTEEPRVEVVELRCDAEIGTLICHLGTSWRVTDLRTHNRVIICRPAQA